MKPQVSIVVTCYNYGQYVTDCLDSIQNQTFSDFEVIVVDDGSTDNSVEKIKSFLKDRRFRCITQQNGGQANAKNRGIKESKAELVAFLDADDIWESNKLEKQIKLLTNPAVGVVYSKARIINANGEPTENVFSGQYLTPRSGNVSKWLFLDNFVWFSSSIVRRDCFEKYGMFDETISMGIDWDLWLKISTGYEFDFVDEQLIAYRTGHVGQMSKNMETRHRCADFIMARFLKEYPGIIDRETIQLSYYITYCNRGEFFGKSNTLASCQYYIKALHLNPMKKRAYKGIVKNIINWRRRIPEIIN